MTLSPSRIAAIAVASLLVAVPAAIGAAPAKPAQADARSPMTFAALEKRAIALGLRPTELKISHRKAEIEGRDAGGRKVEVKLDPFTGEMLRRDFDND